MQPSNYERMIQLAEDVFHVKSDPGQLDVNEEVMEKLQALHPATLSEYDEGDGPIVWILLIPTTERLMMEFLSGSISEKELFEKTPAGIRYETIYLCSALVLEEFRKKGLAQKLTIDAINSIRNDHDIHALFVWPFSEAGLSLSSKVAGALNLPIYQKTNPVID